MRRFVKYLSFLTLQIGREQQGTLPKTGLWILFLFIPASDGIEELEQLYISHQAITELNCALSHHTQHPLR